MTPPPHQGRIVTRSTATAPPLATTHRPTHGPTTSPHHGNRSTAHLHEPTHGAELHHDAAAGERRHTSGERDDAQDDQALDTKCWNRGSTNNHKNTRHGNKCPGRRTTCMLASLIPLGSTLTQGLHGHLKASRRRSAHATPSGELGAHVRALPGNPAFSTF